MSTNAAHKFLARETAYRAFRRDWGGWPGCVPWSDSFLTEEPPPLVEGKDDDMSPEADRRWAWRHAHEVYHRCLRLAAERDAERAAEGVVDPPGFTFFTSADPRAHRTTGRIPASPASGAVRTPRAKPIWEPED